MSTVVYLLVTYLTRVGYFFYLRDSTNANIQSVSKQAWRYIPAYIFS